jgi:predicted alpha/beta superfamily hydrolase
MAAGDETRSHQPGGKHTSGEGSGATRTIASRILGETRTYWVHLPVSYGEEVDPGRRYPVVVILDGHFHRPWATTAVTFLSRVRRMPEAIVVGIHNRNEARGRGPSTRARDLTPTHSLIHYDGKPNDVYRASGGADRFLRFVTEEVLAEVGEAYRTTLPTVLVGHSLGGQCTLHAFLSDHKSFQGYVALDPCIWWDERLAVRRAEVLPEGGSVFRSPLYVGFSDTPEDSRKGQRDFFATLQAKAGPARRDRVGFKIYDGEYHASMYLKGLLDGLTFVFRERPGADAPEGG